MTLEKIKLSDLLKACDKAILSTKENIKELSIEGNYNPIYVQKNKQGFMFVMDGRGRLETLSDFAKVDTTVLCDVDYVEEFDFSKLIQFEKPLDINIGESEYKYESGKLIIPKNKDLDKIDEAHIRWGLNL